MSLSTEIRAKCVQRRFKSKDIGLADRDYGQDEIAFFDNVPKQRFHCVGKRLFCGDVRNIRGTFSRRGAGKALYVRARKYDDKARAIRFGVVIVRQKRRDQKTFVFFRPIAFSPDGAGKFAVEYADEFVTFVQMRGEYEIFVDVGVVDIFADGIKDLVFKHISL